VAADRAVGAGYFIVGRYDSSTQEIQIEASVNSVESAIDDYWETMTEVVAPAVPIFRRHCSGFFCPSNAASSPDHGLEE
jgi:hypothetical protein